MNSPGDASLTPRPWQGTVQASIARSVGVDEVEEVAYTGAGVFTRLTRIVSGLSPLHVVVLDPAARAELLDELRADVANPPVGTNTLPLRVFVELLEASLWVDSPSRRFDGVRFGTATYDESRNIIYGHVGIGVDVAGTVRDASHQLSFEQHVVVLPPGPYIDLSGSDRASLAQALTAFLAGSSTPDALWGQILTDTNGS